MIKNSIISKNIAIGSGGGIHCENSELEFSNTTIKLNKALIGGGLRYLIIVPKAVRDSYNVLRRTNRRFLSNVVGAYIFENEADIMGKNVSSYPAML